MYKENKTTERPKVRFCQPSLESSIENCESVSQVVSMKKPRIRSIINLDNSSKIIYNRNGNLINCEKSIVETDNKSFEEKKFLSSETVDKEKLFTCSRKEKDSKFSDKTFHDIEKPVSFSNDKESPDRIDKSTKCLGKDENKITEVKKSVIIQEKKNCVKIGKSKNCLSKISRITPTFCKKLTEKSSTVINNDEISSKTTTNLCKDKQSNLCFGRGLTTTATSSLTGSKNVKPSIKTWKTKSKNSPVKKTILRDVSVSSTNVYVGPGVARYYPQTFRRGAIDRSKDTIIREEVVSEKKLGRPEYNSIICTIDELKRVKSEKFVTDVDHLPLFYKNLVNEKVSAALDFPPDEAIFKNLVDLSVNEDQLPSRFTRSKDPEPRNRDVSPKLSDFFTPSYSEEYCSAVNITPIIPDIVSNWSAFVISDKIFGWKQDMDQC